MSNLKQNFSTGEFAKLCGVSKQTLIYYDKIGLFKPDHKNENNFRSYSLNQYDTLDTLIALKDLGMSLEDISNYLNNRTPDLGVQMLMEEKRKIEEKIKRLKGISNKIGDKIKIINDGINSNLNREAYIREIPEEYLIVSNLNSNSVTEILSKVTELINYSKDHKINSGYPIGAILSKENIHSNRYTEIGSLFMKVDRSVKSNRIHVKPAGKYGCINHIGTYETTYKSYQKLLDYIKDAGYEVIGDSYEWIIFDALTVKSQNEYLTQITIPIK